MRAVVLEEFGEPEVLRLREVPDPRPGPGEVLVRVEAAGVCYHDLLTRSGHIRHGMTLPVIPGHEIAGTVVETGPGVASLAAGDRVCSIQLATCGECLHCLRGEDMLCERQRMFGHGLAGGYAEYVVAPARALVKVPDSIPAPQAAILGCGVGTSFHAIRTAAAVRGGETVLVTGAGGGTGLHSVQIARAFGARVIAVTTSPGKETLIREHGADEVVVAPDGQFHEAVRRLSGGGVDVVIDHVGTPVWASTIRSVRNGGRICFIGQVTGDTVPFNPGLIILRQISLIGTKGAGAAEIRELVELVRLGRVRPVVAEVLPLERAADAHRLLAERRAAGRVVLAPGA